MWKKESDELRDTAPGLRDRQLRGLKERKFPTRPTLPKMEQLEWSLLEKRTDFSFLHFLIHSCVYILGLTNENNYKV